MSARTAGLALVLGGLVALLVVETVAAHDGEHREASSGFQYTGELLVAGVVAGLIAIGLLAWRVTRRRIRTEA